MALQFLIDPASDQVRRLHWSRKVCMEVVDRSSTLEILNQQWRDFVPDNLRLNPEQKRRYLEKQGYNRFCDLLAHLIAWWKLGVQSMKAYKSDSSYEPPSVDVDLFNAKAVASVQDRSEEEIIQEFESTRLEMVDFISCQLTDQDFKNPKIQWQLNIEFIGHYEEHKL